MRVAWWVGGVVGVICALAAPAEAQDPSDDDEARVRFEAGDAAFARGDWEIALSDFERAYELSQRPELLFNIGLAAQRARKRDRAIEALRAYLDALPAAPNRASVQARISELEELIAAEQQRATPARPGESGGERDDDTGGPGPLPWIAIGGGAAVAIGGIVLVVLAMSDISTVENVEDGGAWSDISAAHDRAPVLSGVGFAMIGVGVAAAALGVVLLVVGGDDDDSASASLTIGPGNLTLRGTW